MNTLKKCNWDDLEINEVFAVEGCWNILIKLSKTKAMLLAQDWDSNFEKYTGKECKYVLQESWYGGEGASLFFNDIPELDVLNGDESYIYRLPKSVQKFFKQEL